MSQTGNREFWHIPRSNRRKALARDLQIGNMVEYKRSQHTETGNGSDSCKADARSLLARLRSRALLRGQDGPVVPTTNRHL